MKTNHTSESLIKFEERVRDSFKNKEILAPVHLYDGNENQMLWIFENVKENDWVFCSWRSHYQCLLKGVSEDRLMEEIKKGKSISLCFPEYKIFSSAIVGGSIPIANGVALSNKLKGNDDHVWCFLGDMTSETGCFAENYKFSVNHDLPITWVIENNGKSVCTDTLETWGQESLTFGARSGDIFDTKFPKTISYTYQTKYPHAGGGERIQF